MMWNSIASFTLAILFIESVHAHNDGSLQPSLHSTNERTIHLHLDESHVSSVTVAAVTSFVPEDAPLFIEKFQLPLESLSNNALELLQSGGTLKATAVQIAPFRVRSDHSGDLVSVEDPHHLTRHLTQPTTLCGGTVARGLMSVTIEDTGKSIPCKTNYIPAAEVGHNATTNRKLIESSNGRLLQQDICEAIDGFIGGCTQQATCHIKFTRRKREQREVCLTVDKCGRRVKGTITFLSGNEVEEQFFEGECRTIVLTGPDDCECFLTQAGQQALNNWRNEPLPPPQCSGTSCTGKGSGDPHFVTFDGSHYSYHGECDMVMAHSESFADGLGLDVHIRTTIQHNFSFISSAAVKIGDDIFEVNADAASPYFNGADSLPVPQVISKFPLSVKIRAVECLSTIAVGPCAHRTVYKIDLGHGEEIVIAEFKGMLKVQINAVVPDAIGLLGTWGVEGLIGRDGKTVFGPTDMGQEWQVGSDDPLLFHDIRAPQYPQTCILPSNDAPLRRLGEDAALLRLGEDACANVVDIMQKAACVFDVQSTGDADMALEYMED